MKSLDLKTPRELNDDELEEWKDAERQVKG